MISASAAGIRRNPREPTEIAKRKKRAGVEGYVLVGWNLQETTQTSCEQSQKIPSDVRNIDLARKELDDGLCNRLELPRGDRVSARSGCGCRSSSKLRALSDRVRAMSLQRTGPTIEMKTEADPKCAPPGCSKGCRRAPHKKRGPCQKFAPKRHTKAHIVAKWGIDRRKLVLPGAPRRSSLWCSQASAPLETHTNCGSLGEVRGRSSSRRHRLPPLHRAKAPLESRAFSLVSGRIRKCLAARPRGQIALHTTKLHKRPRSSSFSRPGWPYFGRRGWPRRKRRSVYPFLLTGLRLFSRLTRCPEPWLT